MNGATAFIRICIKIICFKETFGWWKYDCFSVLKYVLYHLVFLILTIYVWLVTNLIVFKLIFDFFNLLGNEAGIAFFDDVERIFQFVSLERVFFFHLYFLDSTYWAVKIEKYHFECFESNIALHSGQRGGNKSKWLFHILWQIWV